MGLTREAHRRAVYLNCVNVPTFGVDNEFDCCSVSVGLTREACTEAV